VIIEAGNDPRARALVFGAAFAHWADPSTDKQPAAHIPPGSAIFSDW